ncbi:MAG: divalent metal cation transporter [Phycisphaeraceae bacterium]|nr:MAG: divalent metal cation transporter [Phycisphaeraceae bacterium]
MPADDHNTAQTRLPGTWLKAIGPGILFAGAAIGVSHLVQSTKAGAVYGLGLVVFVLLAHAMKLPAMLFGPRYAAVTGTSLVQAYRRQGRHAIWTFALLTLGTMFIIQAAVTIVTAAIVKTVLVDPVLGVNAPMWSVALGLLAICAALVAIGGFGWLDVALKVLMVIMACSTLLAAGLETPRLDPDRLSLLPQIPDDEAARFALIAAIVGLMGWMPAPLDIAVWHSLWTICRRDQTGHNPSTRECGVDFGLGYALCVVLAICFVMLGAGELYLRGISPEKAGPAFAAQLIDLYTGSMGAWVRPIISACAIAVMFSTTFTVLDALARTSYHILLRLRSDEDPNATGAASANVLGYWIMMVVIAAGAMVIITRIKGPGFAWLINLATTLSFLGTPILAWFNHRAMFAGDIPIAHRPGPVLRVWSWIGIFFWVAFSALYLWTLSQSR